MILENPKRLGIFFFYDAQGHADRYVSTLLDGFKPFFNELAIVVNGKIDEPSKAMLKSYANKFILRENKGFDVWAYKTAMDSYGYLTLRLWGQFIRLAKCLTL